jgi:putative Ca2+/H+ antiporter (TMEM165/GDT1 family)
LSELFAIFAAVFIAELGDKTQLATMLFAADKDHHPVTVFIAASGALVASTAIAVGLGAVASKYFEFLPLKAIAGVGFVVIGAWMIYEHFASTSA